MKDGITGVLDIALALHMDHTGSCGDHYADWASGRNDGEAERQKDIEYLQERLENWKPSTRPFDEAVRNLLRAALVEIGEVPRG